MTVRNGNRTIGLKFNYYFVRVLPEKDMFNITNNIAINETL